MNQRSHTLFNMHAHVWNEFDEKEVLMTSPLRYAFFFPLHIPPLPLHSSFHPAAHLPWSALFCPHPPLHFVKWSSRGQLG